MIVSQYVTVANVKQPTNEIWRTYYLSKKDGTLDMLYMPPKPLTVTGTVYYGNGTTPAPNMTVYFVYNNVFNKTTPSATTNSSGVYKFTSEDAKPISPNTTYSVQIWSGWTRIYPPTGGTLNYTTGADATTSTFNITMTGVAAP